MAPVNKLSTPAVNQTGSRPKIFRNPTSGRIARAGVRVAWATRGVGRALPFIGTGVTVAGGIANGDSTSQIAGTVAGESAGAGAGVAASAVCGPAAPACGALTVPAFSYVEGRLGHYLGPKVAAGIGKVNPWD